PNSGPAWKRSDRYFANRPARPMPFGPEHRILGEKNMQQAAQTEKIVNGVNVTELFNTVDAIKGDGEIAKFNFRATNKWINGAQNRTEIRDFGGACQKIDREEPFVIQKDEHPILLRTEDRKSVV